MFDGIKILQLPSKKENIEASEYLDFPIKYSSKSGEELSHIRSSIYKSIKFSIMPDGSIRLEGSIHKYSNNGLHNYDDFTLQKCRDTIYSLENMFGFDASQARLNNLEFGINLKLDYPVSRFLESIISYGMEHFYPMNKAIIKDGKGIECKLYQLIFKIYDKGYQNSLGYSLVRIEIKVIDMTFFKPVCKHPLYLKDLGDELIWHQIKAKFLNILNKLSFCDCSIDIDNLNITNKEKLLISRGENPKYWTKIRPDSMIKKKEEKLYNHQRYVYNSFRKKFNELISKNNLDTIFKDFIAHSDKKIDELIRKDLYKLDTTNINEIEVVYYTDSIQIRTISKVPESILPESIEKKWINIINAYYSQFPDIDCFQNYVKKLVEPTNHTIVSKKFDNLLKAEYNCWDTELFDLEIFFRYLTIPVDPIKLSKYNVTINLRKYIDSHISTISNYNGNYFCKPYLIKLIILKEIIQKYI